MLQDGIVHRVDERLTRRAAGPALRENQDDQILVRIDVRKGASETSMAVCSVAGNRPAIAVARIQIQSPTVPGVIPGGSEAGRFNGLRCTILVRPFNLQRCRGRNGFPLEQPHLTIPATIQKQEAEFREVLCGTH